MICSSDALAGKDVALGAVFRDSREKLDETARAAKLAEQRRWLQARFTACGVPVQGEMPADRHDAAVSCLINLYAGRIAELQTPPNQAAPNQAQTNTPANAAPKPSPEVKPAVTPTPAATADSSSVKLDKSLFPAKGNNETLAGVGTFGRYAISVKSDQGTALQLVDRMAGPSAVDGSAGHSDGRIDAFLDRGQYKIKLFSDPRGSGDAELTVTPSTELSADPVQLVELKPVAAQLGDHEQRSYWLDIKQRRFVALEAAGRNLADLRLWKDGNWLVDATPVSGERDPNGGEPLATMQLALWLEPGLYRLVAYGGAGEKWSSGSKDKPLYLRYGTPILPAAGRANHEASAFGIDRFLVPKGATYFRLDIDQSERAALSVAPYDPEHPYATGGDRALIDKNNRDPKAEIHPEGEQPKQYWLVTVERKPGARYRLQYFDDQAERGIDIPGNTAAHYWLATLEAGNVEDNLDPTALLVRDGKDVVAAAPFEIDATKNWRRKFNLLDPVFLFLHAGQAADLVVEGAGVLADYKVEPFVVSPPDDYHEPPSQPSGATWSLDAGYSVLIITPHEGSKGVLTLTLRGSKATGAPADQPRLAAPIFSDVGFEKNHVYRLYLGGTGGAYGGASVRELPLDLTHGVSFSIAPGANVTLPIKLSGAGRLDGHTEDGKTIPLSIDGKDPAAGSVLEAGKHSVGLVVAGDRAAFVSLTFTPTAQLETSPLPPVDSARLAASHPDFPVLAPDKPVFLDLPHGARKSFDVAVDKPALYRLESSGIVETSGVLRTRTVPVLDQKSSNGIGRNFLVQQYLREGDYQLTVRGAGKSVGPIGVALGVTPVSDLDVLEPDLWARATLRPGEAGRYRFHIDEAGTYQLKTLGFHHDFSMRLDDAAGWPVLRPGSTANTTLPLDAGDYQMVLLPRPVESRAVTLLHRVTPPAVLSGHGPFALNLGEAGRNRWMEPERGAARVPDQWRFNLPAPAKVTLSVDSGMRATLLGGGKSKDKDRIALSDRPFVGNLPAGAYTVEAVSAAADSRVDYSVTVATAELLAGEKRSVTAPIRAPVSIGAARQVEFESFGGSDVKARLYDRAGKLVAAHDDRENDWNFLISAALQPGHYELQIDPVGAKTAITEIALTQPEESQDSALPYGNSVSLGDGKIHVVPLGNSPANALIVLTAHAATPVGLAFETEKNGQWRSLGTTTGLNPFLALPRGNTQPLRARVWSADHSHMPIDFAASAAVPANATEDALTGHGVTLTALDGTASTVAAASVKLDKRGVLQLGSGATAVWATDTDETASRDASGTIIAASSRLWLIDRADRTAPVAARLIEPNGDDPVRLTLEGRDPVELPFQGNRDPKRIILWQVDGQGGQPGIAVTEAGSSDKRTPLMAIGPASPTLASAVAIGVGSLKQPAVRLWNASDSDELPVTLKRIAFAAPKQVTFGLGITDGSFSGHDALSIALPDGMKRLTLVMPAGTVAVTLHGDAAGQIIWTASSRAEITETTADHLLVLHAADTPSPYSVTVEPLDAKTPVELGPGPMMSRYSPTPGVLHLRVGSDAAATATIRIDGTAEAVTVIDSTGSVSRADRVSAPPGSRISVEYQPGLFAVGLDAAGSVPADPAAPEPLAVETPATVPLTGGHMDVRIGAGSARLVHLTSDAPIMLRAKVPGVAAERSLFGDGAALNFVIGKDQGADLSIDPAGGATLSGALHLAATSLTPMTEGLGPKRRLAPGQSRAFSFVLPEPRQIGVGVRASIDVATSRLLAADGAEIGRGLIQMHALKAGTYVLVIDAPDDGPAIDIEPALVGSVLPDKGPPDSVKADYLALVGKQAKK